MSGIIVHLTPRGVVLTGQAPPRPAPEPRTPPNEGRGDARKGISPVIPFPDGPSVDAWEGGPLRTLGEVLAGAHPAGGDPVGVILGPKDDPLQLVGRLDGLALIAVDFLKLNDGRGYSTATLLRGRIAYRGPLRAVGAVTVDQLQALARVGFDSFALRADQDPAAAEAALRTFSLAYQAAAADPHPALRRTPENLALAKERRLERLLSEIAARRPRAAFASSLQAEDMVITDAIVRLGLPIAVFTLDTGRLHAETLAMIDAVRARYGLEIAVFRPDPAAVEAYVAAHGLNAFYESVALRQACCAIRKVEPLDRALSGRDAWITGQRRDQAMSRADLAEREHDAARGIAKFNPLADWTLDDVMAYVARHDVPLNPLYRRGYASIGCEPCTKAVRPGEDPRAGRWWWESADNKECGLHVAAAGGRA